MSYRSPQELLTAFRDWGVHVRAYEPDGRPWYAHTTAGGWNPHGVLHHHTAGSARLLSSDLSRRAMLRILRNGYAGLPGPLCHFAPAMDGNRRAVLWLVGWGNVNHAGLGDPRVLAQLAAGTYRGERPSTSTADGNRALYGLEYMHPGDSTRWPDELLDVGHRAAAAICDAHGWRGDVGARSNLDHREWTTRKIDRSWRGDVRAAVRAELDAGPDGGTMGWNDKLPLAGTKTDGVYETRPAKWVLSQAWNRAGDARAEARANGRKLDDLAAQLDQLQAELPELVEHAAAAGARAALADSTVAVDVTVNGRDA